MPLCMRLGAGCAPAPSSAPEAAPPTAAPAAKRPAPSRAAVRQKKKQREEAEQMEWELDEREGGFQRGLPKEEAQKLRAKQRRQRMLAREEMGEGRQLFSIPCTLATLLHSGHAPWLLPAIEELVRAYTRVGYDVRALVQFCLTRLAERGAPMPKLDHDFYVHAFQCVTRLGSTSDPDPWQHATSLDRCLLSAAAAELLAEGCLAQPLVDRSGCRHPLYSLATSAAAEVSTHTRTQLRPRLSAWLGMVLGEAAGLSSTHRTRVVRCCIGALMAGQRRPEGWNGNKFAFLLPAQRQLVERVLDGIWQRWRHVLPIKAKLKGPKWVDFIAWGHAMQTDVEAWVHACAVHDLAATALQPPPAAVQPGAGQAAAAAAQPAGPPPQLPFHLSLAMQARAAAVEASAAAAQAEPVAVAARAAADGALEKFPQAGAPALAPVAPPPVATVNMALQGAAGAAASAAHAVGTAPPALIQAAGGAQAMSAAACAAMRAALLLAESAAAASPAASAAFLAVLNQAAAATTFPPAAVAAYAAVRAAAAFPAAAAGQPAGAGPPPGAAPPPASAPMRLLLQAAAGEIAARRAAAVAIHHCSTADSALQRVTTVQRAAATANAAKQICDALQKKHKAAEKAADRAQHMRGAALAAQQAAQVAVAQLAVLAAVQIVAALAAAPGQAAVAPQAAVLAPAAGGHAAPPAAAAAAGVPAGAPLAVAAGVAAAAPQAAILAPAVAAAPPAAGGRPVRRAAQIARVRGGLRGVGGGDSRPPRLCMHLRNQNQPDCLVPSTPPPYTSGCVCCCGC